MTNQENNLDIKNSIEFPTNCAYKEFHCKCHENNFRYHKLNFLSEKLISWYHYFNSWNQESISDFKKSNRRNLELWRCQIEISDIRNLIRGDISQIID